MSLQDAWGSDPIDVQVGLAIRRIRRGRRITQGKLGEALGISFQQVQKYERGANRVSASMLVKAARALGVHAADLLPDEEAPEPPAYIRHLASVRGADELLDRFAAIKSAANRKLVLMVAGALSADERSKSDGGGA